MLRAQLLLSSRTHTHNQKDPKITRQGKGFWNGATMSSWISPLHSTWITYPLTDIPSLNEHVSQLTEELRQDSPRSAFWSTHLKVYVEKQKLFSAHILFTESTFMLKQRIKDYALLNVIRYLSPNKPSRSQNSTVIITIPKNNNIPLPYMN